MRLKPNRTPLILLLLFPLFLQAQAPLPKTLLWRITPPDGGQPSWLCGTIHVQDRRVFHFTDSLYDALGRAQAFAMELDPDTLVQAMFAQLNGRKEAGIIKTKSRTTRQQPKARDDDMPTIVDLYLSRIAKDMGKPVTGLEMFADQSSLVDDLGDREGRGRSKSGGSGFESSMEKMIKVYANGDLQGVYELTKSFDPEEMDKLLVQRNRKMAARIDSFAKGKSYFFAVGAAHLPGQEGLIEAMRRLGYSVDPVRSDRRMEPDHYVFQHREEWKTYSDPYEGWSVSLPGKPFPMNTGKGLDMSGYMDLGDLRMYFLTGVAIGDDDDLLDRDTVFINRLKSVYDKGTEIRIDSVHRVLTTDTLRSWDMIGREQSSDYNVRMRIVFHGGRMFLVCLGAKHAQEIHDARADQYLSSFKPLPVIKGFRAFTDSTMGFSVLMPGLTKKNLSQQDSTVSAWQYTCGNTVDGMAANVIVVTTAPNFVITSDSSYFHASAKHILEGEMTLVRQKDTTVNGQNAFVLEFLSSNGAFLNHTLSIKRGGRIITLLSTEDVDKPSAAARERYFSSLRLLEPDASHWAPRPVPGTDLTVSGPSEWTLRPPDEDAPHGAVFLAFDEQSSVSYNIYLDTLNRYLWSTNDSLLLDHYMSSYHFRGQEELERGWMKTKSGARCMTMTTRVEDSRQVKRVQICLQGDRLLTTTSYLPEEWSHRAQVDGFHNSAVPPQAADAFVLQTRSPRAIFRDLRSDRLDTRDSAYNALTDLYFPNTHFPVLLEEISKGFPQDSAHDTRIQEQLMSMLSDMTDSATPAHIHQIWSRLKKDQEDLRYDLMNMIAALKTKEAFAMIPVLLQEHLPTKSGSFLYFRHMMDTLSLSKGIWKDLLTFSGDSLFGPGLFRLHKALIDSGYLTLEEFRKEFPRMQGALESFDRLMVRDNYSPFSFWGRAVFDLLGRLNDAPSRAWLRRYLNSAGSGGRLFAALELTKQGQPVDPKVWSSVAKDKETRLDLHGELKVLDKLKLYPKEFKNRKSFAESHAWVLSEDDYSPKSIQFLREVTREFEGKQRIFLLYRIVMDDEDGDYSVLAIVGPYKPGSKDLLPVEEDDVSGLFEDEEYTPGLELRHLATYLKGFETEEGGDPEK